MKTRFDYQVWDGNTYKGLIPNVTSDFELTQDINTAGPTDLIIEVGRAPEQHDLAEALLTELDVPILTELDQPILVDAYNFFGADGTINNGFNLLVYKYSDDYPEGLLKFDGRITTHRERYGQEGKIVVFAKSWGDDLDEYIIEGGTSLDQSQPTQDTNATVLNINTDKVTFLYRLGQTFAVGTGINNISSIEVMINTVNGASTGSLNLHTSPSDSDIVATATRSLNTSGPEVVRFTFATPVTVAPTSTLFFSVSPVANEPAFDVYLSTSDVYADGTTYEAAYFGVGGGSWGVAGGGAWDLYFKTYTTTGATSDVYDTQDPADILRSILDSYVSRGGKMSYSSASIDDTLTDADYTFKVQTTLDGVSVVKKLSPASWYWYGDPATRLVEFHQPSTTADHTLVLGKHIKQLDLESTIDNVVNKAIVSGGDIGGGINLYEVYTNQDSIDAIGQQKLEIINDNRLELEPSARLLANDKLDNNPGEVYQTKVVVPASEYNIDLFNLGDTVGFANFANYIDLIVLVIVGYHYSGDSIELDLGVVPRRTSVSVEQLRRDIDKVQTINAPATA